MLTLREITPLKLNWPKLSREICQAYSLTPKFLEMPMYNTVQMGHWAGTVPKETEQTVAERAFALIKTLDAHHSMTNPNLLTTFRLYCIENMSAAAIAKMFGRAKSVIIDRLDLIRKKTGVDPEQLRRLSSHFSKLEDEISDSRAARIYRKGTIQGEEPDPD